MSDNHDNHDSHDDKTARLKAAVYLSVSTMVDRELEDGVTATPTFIASLVELVYNQLLLLGEDLESFAHHAGRSTINPSDMYMVTRKNPKLTQVLKSYADSL